jgi:hypothetical protein
LHESAAGHEAIAPGATFGAESSAAPGFARLFIVFAATNFFLDAAPLHEFPEATHSFLNGLFVPERQLDHISSFRTGFVETKPAANGRPAACPG